jgi:hypothetical protein
MQSLDAVPSLNYFPVQGIGHKGGKHEDQTPLCLFVAVLVPGIGFAARAQDLGPGFHKSSSTVQQVENFKVQVAQETIGRERSGENNAIRTIRHD